MAITKTLNTKIALRYDSYENWIANDPILLKGELALAAVTVAQDGNVEHVPSVLIKCGDGTHKYSELDYVFAKAADVISAAKSESALTTFVNNVISNAGIATDEAMTALAGRVTTAEGEIDALQGLVGDTAVATQITNAINALDLANTYAAKAHTHTKSEITDFAHTHAIADVTGLQTALDEAKKAGTDANTALEAYKVTNDAVVKANTDAISAINNETTGILAQAKSYADGKDTAIAAAKSAADAAQADVDALEAKVGTVVDGKTVVEMISDAQTAATYNDTQVKADIKTNADDIAALQGLVGETAVSDQINAKITALNLANTYEAKGAAATAKSEVIGTDDDTADSNTIKGAKKYADSLDAAMDTRVDALEAAVGEGGSVATQITAEIQKLDKEDAAVDGQYVSAVSEADGIITVTRAALPDYSNIYDAKGAAAQALTDAKAYADGLDIAMDARMDTAESKLTTLIGSDADKSVRTIANEELAAQLIPETAKESLNTLQEIAAWIQAHPDDASAMNTRISDLETLVGDDPVSTQINTAIEALKIGDYAKAADLTAAVARIAALEADTHTHANKALLDTYTQTEADLADAVAKKHEHANATELDKFVDGDKAKLDTAVQTVTAGTGLTATKTGTDVAIAFDDTTTFIFDCGTSAE